jgi:glycosyltransferase involved in cell wall biosynthesis
MVKADFDVYVVTKQFGSTPLEENLGAVKVRRISVHGKGAFANASFVFMAFLLALRIRPNIVHSHELHLPTIAGVLIKIILRIPLVVTIHTQGPLIGDVAVVKRAFLGKARLYTFRRLVDKFIAISRTLDIEMANAGIPRNKRVTIPNGIDMQCFSPVDQDTRRQLRHELSLPDGLITIISGRLVWEKRVQNLLQIWPQIRYTFPNAWLLVVGSGEYEENFRSRNVEGVILTGEVKNVASYIQASDILAMLSEFEGFSLSVLEGLACGIPVVATPVGAIPQLISHEMNGLIVPVDDLPALQTAILMLLGEPSLRSQFGKIGRESVVHDYSWDVLSDKLTTTYMSAINHAA